MRRNQSIVETYFGHAAPALTCLMTARMVNQDLSHNPGGDSEEMRPAVPFRRALVYQPEIGFMDKRRGL